MAKNIAIFLDGTWNQVDNYTNVYSLYQYCRGTEIDVDGDKTLWDPQQANSVSDQKRYYDPGVGTSLTSSPMLIGGAIGFGLKTNVAQAYLCLCREYEPGDNIFIFGFSRGAYTARSLGGILNCLGVLSPKWIKPILKSRIPIRKRLAQYQALKIPRLAVATSREANRQSQHKRELIIKRFKEKYCSHEEVRIKFMGIFDTVGSLGIPSLLNPLGNHRSFLGNISKHFFRRNLMPNHMFPKNIDYACHALAIDEHRPHFKPTLWTQANNRVEQRWFIGAHSNIGGGYPNNLLNNKPMYWIYQHARSHGLRMGNFLLPHESVHLDEPVKDSFATFRVPYRLLNYSEYYRSLDHSDTSQSLDRSVHSRVLEDPIYRPPNLMRLEKQAIKALISQADSFDQQLNNRLNLLTPMIGSKADL